MDNGREGELFMMNQSIKQAVSVGVMVMTLVMTAQAADKGSILMKQRLADVAGKEVTVLTVDYAPGGTSESHVHPGSVVAYVLEGVVVSQLEGEAPITYTQGQSWYESPKTPHVMSKNASQTEPAKLLVFLLSQEGEAIKAPVR